jgi:hypothetical protein
MQQDWFWQGDDDLVFGDPRTGAPLVRPMLLERYRRALKAANLDAGVDGPP